MKIGTQISQKPQIGADLSVKIPTIRVNPCPYFNDPYAK